MFPLRDFLYDEGPGFPSQEEREACGYHYDRTPLLTKIFTTYPKVYFCVEDLVFACLFSPAADSELAVFRQYRDRFNRDIENMATWFEVVKDSPAEFDDVQVTLERYKMACAAIREFGATPELGERNVRRLKYGLVSYAPEMNRFVDLFDYLIKNEGMSYPRNVFPRFFQIRSVWSTRERLPLHDAIILQYFASFPEGKEQWKEFVAGVPCSESVEKKLRDRYNLIPHDEYDMDSVRKFLAAAELNDPILERATSWAARDCLCHCQ